MVEGLGFCFGWVVVGWEVGLGFVGMSVWMVVFREWVCGCLCWLMWGWGGVYGMVGVECGLCLKV